MANPQPAAFRAPNPPVVDLQPGAHVGSEGTTFIVYAPLARDVGVRLFDVHGAAFCTISLAPSKDGMHRALVRGVGEGALYKLVLDGDEVPDPYARWLPTGVQGPACVMSPRREAALATPPAAHAWTIYELHVGTFTPEGTYRAAIDRLDALANLGVTAIELMPVAAFAGKRGWGYDGVALYAPFAPYGAPDDLRAFVRGAHQRGLAVVLDVVYNHFGPAGNYLTRFSDAYFDETTKTPWGAAPDFAHPPMRSLVVENARYWLAEFGFDGLRLDATQAIGNPSGGRHVVAEICELAHAMTPPRRVFLEDERNDAAFVAGVGADGVWADDFHHQVHVLLTGERDGYYAAYEPTLAALAGCIEHGWTYVGQPFAPWQGKPRGGTVAPLRPEQLVVCIQNHDQVGNRALGTRLNTHVSIDAFCAAVMLQLFLPMTPLLFMGQEWGASSPFLFFSDHDGELGERVTTGRRAEFAAFTAFADPEVRARIPDPQHPETAARSTLRWKERSGADNARILGVHRDMLLLRRNDPVLSVPDAWSTTATVHDGVLEVMRHHGGSTRRLLINFAEEPRLVAAARPGRILIASGPLADGRLGPHGAAILAEGPVSEFER